MATHTFSGNILDRVGGDLVSPNGMRARGFLQPASEVVAEDGESRVGSIEVTIATDGTFSVADLPEDGYRFELSFYWPAAERSGRTTWRTPWFLLDDDLDLADVVADNAQTYVPTRGGIDHGDVSGSLTLSAAHELHVINLTGDTTITPDGPVGTNMAVWVEHDSEGDDLILGAGVEWDSAELVIPGKMLLTHWPDPVGWRATAVAPIEPVEVTPTFDDDTDFNDTGNVLVIPDDTGIQYKRNGDNIAAGTHPGQSAGLMTITAVAKTGYVLASGADDEWTHTYPALPGRTTVVEDTFTDSDGTLLSAHEPDTGPSNLWSGADSGHTIQSGKASTNNDDNGTSITAEVDTGSVHHWVTFDYDLSGQKIGNLSYVEATIWGGGVRTGGTTSTRNTQHQIRIAKPAYNSSVATLSARSSYISISPNDTVPALNPENGHDLAAVPLTGTLEVEALEDDTFGVYIDGDLWATGAKLTDGGGGTVTVGQKARAAIFAAQATMDNLTLDGYV